MSLYLLYLISGIVLLSFILLYLKKLMLKHKEKPKFSKKDVIKSINELYLLDIDVKDIYFKLKEKGEV